MSEFADALICESKSNTIPDTYNLFGPLIGEWDFEWVDNHGTEKERHIKGIFTWVLDGTAIQDIFNSFNQGMSSVLLSKVCDSKGMLDFAIRVIM